MGSWPKGQDARPANRKAGQNASNSASAAALNPGVDPPRTSAGQARPGRCKRVNGEPRLRAISNYYNYNAAYEKYAAKSMTLPKNTLRYERKLLSICKQNKYDR